MIRLLIADDSPTCRILMRKLLSQHEDFQIVGEARDGLEAVRLTLDLRPDIVVMDLVMPALDGILATAEIMELMPTPIVIVSSSQSIHEASTAMKALSAGALSLIDKPRLSCDPGVFSEGVLEFTRTIRLMSAVKVVRHLQKSRESGLGLEIARAGSARYAARKDSEKTLQGEQVIFSPARVEGIVPNMTGARSTGAFSAVEGKEASNSQSGSSTEGLEGGVLPLPKHRPRIIAIASSTGGPPALWQLTQSLPIDYPIPIVVVQHIGRGFVQGMVAWLNRGDGVKAKVAQAGEPLTPGTVFVAPDDLHIGTSCDGRVQLSKTPPIGGFRPSATFLFDSVASAFGEDVIAIVLTGMGDDGAAALGQIKRRGGLVVAQDRPSSIIYGMPAAAVATGHTDLVLPLWQIPEYLRLLGEL